MIQNLKIIADLQDNASQKLQELNGLLGGLGQGLVTGALVAAGAFVVNEFANMTKAAIDFGNSLDDMSQRTGVSAEELSRLAYAAQMSDTTLEGIQGGFRKLSQALVESQDASSRQAKIFDQIGISTVDASGKLKDTNVVMEELADVFNAMPDGAAKTALAMDLLGKAGADMIPYLNNGAEGLKNLKDEADEFGQVWNAEQSAQAAEFNDNLDKITGAFSNIFTKIAQQVLPTLITLSEAFVSSAKEGGLLNSIIDGIVWSFEQLEILSKPLFLGIYVITTAFTTLGKVIGGVGAAVAAFLSGDFSGSKNIISMMKEDLAKTADEAVDFYNKLDKGRPVVDDVTEGNDKLGKTYKGVGDSAKKASDDIAKYLDNLRKTRDQIGMDDKDKALYDLEQEAKKIGNSGARNRFLAEGRSIIEDTEVRKANQKAVEDQAEAFKKLSESKGKEVLKTEDIAFENSLVDLSNEQRKIAIELRKMEKDLIGLSADELSKLTAERKKELETQSENARLENLIAETTDKRIDKSRVNMQTLASALNAGRITEKTYLEAVQIEMERMKDKTKETADQMTEFFKAAAQSIQQSMSSFIFDFMQGKLSDLSGNIKRVIDKMVADMLAAQMATMLFGADFGKQGGSIGGIAGAMGSYISGFRAEGGDVSAGRAYVVGEKRPELFIPKTDGYIKPDTSGVTSSSGGVQINITAMDSQDVMRVLSSRKREIAEMVGTTSRNYNIRG